MADEPAWVRIQKKTFTRWCNNYLQQRGAKVEDLQKDLADGITLHTLLEILGNEEVLPKANRKAKLKLQKVENLNTCLRYIKSKNINLVNIGAEDIHDGKIKLILGLIWTLILRFQIMAEDEESAGARQALLDWCNSVLNPQGLFVKNFTSDWQDGRCFCGLVNAIEPSHIPLHTVPASEAVSNMNKAFTEAEKLFGFPQVLDAIDVVENPDDLSIMTYVSYFRAYMLANNAFGPNCTAEGPGLTEATTFEKAPFTIITFNEEGERVERGGAMIKCLLTDEAGQEVTKVSVQDNKNGTYSCFYIAERPGHFTLDIQVKKQGIKSNPFKPFVKPGEPSPAMCEAVGPGISSAVAGEEAKFTVITKDILGNKIPRGGANIKGVFKDPKGAIDVTIVDLNDGTYACSYVPITSGTTQLSVTVITVHNGTGEIKASPFSVAVSPAAASGKNSTASGPGIKAAVAGEENPFDVQTRDRFDNIIKTGGADVAGELVHAETGEKVPVRVQDRGDGTYACSYPDVKRAGTYTLTPTVAKEGVKDAPFTVTVKEAAADALHFVWEGLNLDADGNNVVVAGVTEKFTVIARDRFDNRVTTGGLKIKATFKKGPAPVEAKVTDKQDGSYEIEYTPTKSGLYELAVSLEETLIGGSKNPFNVICIPADPYGPTSLASGEGTKAGVAGEPNPFDLQVRDKFENNLTQGGADVGGALVSDKGETVPVKVEDKGDGTYKITYPEVKSAGTYKLTPTVGGAPVKDAPFTVTITEAAADAASFKWEGLNLDADGNNVVVAGTTEKFTVIAFDRFMNRVTTGGLAISGKISGPSEVAVKVTDHKDGSYGLEYTPTKAAKYSVTVFLSETAIGGSKNPFSLLCIPAEAYGPTSEASGEGLSEAVAGEPNPFFVGSHDRFDNECTKGGADVKATLTHTADASVVVTAEIEDEQDGTYQATYASIQRAGQYSLVPTIKGEPVKGAPFTVTVHPALPDAASFTWDGPELDGDGNKVVVAGVTEKFTVTARDRFGNQAEAGGLKIAGKISAGPAEVEVQTTDNGDGTYTLSYTPIKAGQYQFTVLFDEAPIGGHANPFGLKCIPAEPYGPTSIASGEGIKAGAVGSKNEFIVQTRDKFDNIVTKGGAKLGGAVVHEESKAEVPLTATDLGDGTYRLAYAGVTKKGRYALTPLVEGQPVKDAPFTIAIAAGGFDLSQSGIEIPNPSQAGRRGPKVSVKDSEGNLREGFDDHVEADLTPKLKIPSVKARSNGDGTYEIDYPPELLPGPYEIDVRINGQAAPQGTLSTDISLAPLSEEQSQALAETVPEESKVFDRLLKNATEAERQAVIGALKRLAGK